MKGQGTIQSVYVCCCIVYRMIFFPCSFLLFPVRWWNSPFNCSQFIYWERQLTETFYIQKVRGYSGRTCWPGWATGSFFHDREVDGHVLCGMLLVWRYTKLEKSYSSASQTNNALAVVSSSRDGFFGSHGNRSVLFLALSMSPLLETANMFWWSGVLHKNLQFGASASSCTKLKWWAWALDLLLVNLLKCFEEMII